MLEAKWPFLLLLFFFLGLTGYVMSKMDRAAVMQNWTERRCDMTIMLAARFFRPENDPRTPSAFASDNFDFCVKQFSDTFMNMLMAPISWLMGKQAGMAGVAMTGLQQVRDVVNRVRDAFLSYISSYTEKLKGSMKELRRVFLYLRMGIQRMIAIAMSTIYMGMTLFRGMLTSIQTVIRVILIICAIMIAVIIILWFILLPVIPFILTTLTAVVALVGALSVVLSGSLASQAESQKGGFCFRGDTEVCLTRGAVPMREVQVGDVICDPSGQENRVTMYMEVTGEGVEEYELDGIYVSGDHRVQGQNGVWNLVRNDPRAHRSSSPSSSPSSPFSPIYCLNTTTHCIPLRGKSGSLLLFRDWEEFDEADEEGHHRWREGVFHLLNPGHVVPLEKEQGGDLLPLLSPDTPVRVPGGFRPLSSLRMGDILLSQEGRTQRVLGRVEGEALQEEGIRWNAPQQRWVPWRGSTLTPHRGWNLITETGEWSTTDGRIRDFTEVGHSLLPLLYPLVEECLSGSPSSPSPPSFQ